MITFSIIVPVYNEEKNIPELYERITAVMKSLSESYEIILVNDGSRDSSFNIMHDLHERDDHIKVINFSRNFGHQTAITAGIDYASGQAVITIDADLQDPPELIVEFVEKWRNGFDIVYAVRTMREGETPFKEFTAKLFYRLLRRITNIDIPIDTGDFRLMDRKVIETLRQMRERHRFIRGMSSWVGFKQIGVKYRRHARHAGDTKYPLNKMIKFALDGITSFSYVPLQFATYLGFALAVLSAIFIVFVIVARLSISRVFLGQATTLVVVLFLGGVQLISLGILGEYLGRIYDEVKERPIYIVSETYGFTGGQKPPQANIVDVSSYRTVRNLQISTPTTSQMEASADENKSLLDQ